MTSANSITDPTPFEADVNRFLLARIGSDAHEAAMSRPNVRKFEMNGRSMMGWIVVDSAELGDDAALASWVQEGATFARSLPPE